MPMPHCTLHKISTLLVTHLYTNRLIGSPSPPAPNKEGGLAGGSIMSRWSNVELLLDIMLLLGDAIIYCWGQRKERGCVFFLVWLFVHLVTANW